MKTLSLCVIGVITVLLTGCEVTGPSVKVKGPELKIPGVEVGVQGPDRAARLGLQLFDRTF